MRLNRYLSLCGLGSRRGCEDIILQGRVSINGHVVKTLATTVADSDEVVADAKPVRPASSVVIALHKPKGYLCTRSDTHERATIYDLLPPKYQTLHHVGRLDKESEGLLLMTNRGDLSHRLLHPSQGVEKEYEVTIDTPFEQENLAKLVTGIYTEEGVARAERAWMVTPRRLHMVLKQGLKRQIRLMLFALGHEVETLIRIRIGQMKLYGLPKGGWKELTEAEVQRFFSKSAESKPRIVKDKPERDQAELAAESDTVRPTRRPSPNEDKRTAPREDKSRVHRPVKREYKPREQGENKPRTHGPAKGEHKPRRSAGDDAPRKPYRGSGSSDAKPTTNRYAKPRASAGDDTPRKPFRSGSSRDEKPAPTQYSKPYAERQTTRGSDSPKPTSGPRKTGGTGKFGGSAKGGSTGKTERTSKSDRSGKTWPKPGQGSERWRR